MDYLFAAIYGIVEGITEWLPISSTGHMILLEEFLKMDVSEGFWNLFLVVVQLGAILAVVLLYWRKLWPFFRKDGKVKISTSKFLLWCKIVLACVPAAVVGLLFDDKINELFYNYTTVAIMLILFGVLFLVVETKNKSARPTVTKVSQLSFQTAFLIGLFQLIAAVFPGTSRSGATIVGALMLGVSRTVAAEFTFFLAIPVMFGASLLKLIKFEEGFTATEGGLLVVGMLVAFLVSVAVIKFLMQYIKGHDFKVFGYYRIVLGVLVLLYGFFLAAPLTA